MIRQFLCTTANDPTVVCMAQAAVVVEPEALDDLALKGLGRLSPLSSRRRLPDPEP